MSQIKCTDIKNPILYFLRKSFEKLFYSGHLNKVNEANKSISDLSGKVKNKEEKILQLEGKIKKLEIEKVQANKNTII